MHMYVILPSHVIDFPLDQPHPHPRGCAVYMGVFLGKKYVGTGIYLHKNDSYKNERSNPSLNFHRYESYKGRKSVWVGNIFISELHPPPVSSLTDCPPPPPPPRQFLPHVGRPV